MAFMTVKLVPGVHAEQTPLLLQAGVVQSNNVRWKDGLPEKIGGWKKFYPSALLGPVRELWTWLDLNGGSHLAAAGGSNVTLITTNSATKPITPQSVVRHPTVFQATSGSREVVITDVGSNSTTYEAITLQTPVAFVGAGILRPGNYPITRFIDADHYAITIPAPSAATVAGTCCTITSANGSASFSVHLSGSTGTPPPLLAVGSSFPVVIPTTVGGVILNGFYNVATVIDANNFTILAQNLATSVQTVNYGNVANPGFQVVQWVIATQQAQTLITAAAAFSAGYSGIAMPNNPGTIVPGMTVVNQTTGQILGTVASYGPLAVTQAAQPFAAGQTSINMAPYNNSPGIIPGMTVTDVGVGSLGTVSSYVGNTLTLSAAATFNAHYTVTAQAAFTTNYAAIKVPANPGWVTTGMPVLDLTTGQALGTVDSYGLSFRSATNRNGYGYGTTTITMFLEGWRSALPGFTVKYSGATIVGTVSSYIGTTLVLTAGALYPANSGDSLEFDSAPQNVMFITIPGGVLGPLQHPSGGANDVLGFGLADTVTFSSGSSHVLVFTAPLTSGSAGAGDVLAFSGNAPPTITASAAFTTDYAAIKMPANPGWVTTGMTVFDQTTSQLLGTVDFYGLSNRSSGNKHGVFIGATTIDMFLEGWRIALPGMKVVGGSLIGTVASYIGNTLVLTAGALSPAAPNEPLEFDSAPQNVMFIIPPGGVTGPLVHASGGANDVLAFIGASGPPPAGTTPYSASDWCMFNFGSILLINPEDGPIFQYDPTTGLANAQIVSNAPSKVHGMFLAMPQQMVVAYGASVQGVQDPMLVAWSDAGNFNTWTLAVDNQAGTFRLSRGSRIVGGIQAPMQAMLWTDVGLWLMTYIGYPDVWGFSEVAQECGLIAKKAVGVIGGQVFWMGQDRFWTFTGGQVQPLPCEVWDAVFQNINRDLVDLIRCGTDTGFDGIGWFFPSLATKQPGAIQENDSYIKLNRVTGEWDYGTPVDVFGDGNTGGAMVSDWIDANVFGNPISAMTDSTGTQSQLMWMDMGQDADGAPIDWWIRTGLFVLSEGEDFIFIDRCRPDFRWRKFSNPTTPSAQVKITLYAQDDADNPLKPPKVFGPYTVTDSTVTYPGGTSSAGSNAFDPRARGRYFSLKVEGDDLGSFVRLGAVKFRFSPDGRAG